MKELLENIYLFEDTCNVYVVRNGRQAILIDFGAGEVLDHLSEIGVEEVCAVLMTHHHRNQDQGLPRAAAAGIGIWVPDAERDLFASLEEHWQAREIFNNYNVRQDRFSLLKSIPIEGILKDYATHHFAGLDVKVLPTPGHTVGSIKPAPGSGRQAAGLQRRSDRRPRKSVEPGSHPMDLQRRGGGGCQHPLPDRPSGPGSGSAPALTRPAGEPAAHSHRAAPGAAVEAARPAPGIHPHARVHPAALPEYHPAPAPPPGFHADGILARLSPYQASVPAGEPLTYQVEVRNPYPHPACASLQVVIHPEWEQAGGYPSPRVLYLELGPLAAGVSSFTVHTPTGLNARQARIAVDVAFEEHRFGIQAEALLTIRTDLPIRKAEKTT